MPVDPKRRFWDPARSFSITKLSGIRFEHPYNRSNYAVLPDGTEIMQREDESLEDFERRAEDMLESEDENDKPASAVHDSRMSDIDTVSNSALC